MNTNKKFENAQRIKQSLIETWDLCRKHFYPEGRRIRYQPTMQMMDDEQPHTIIDNCFFRNIIKTVLNVFKYILYGWCFLPI
jgi:hypothetical protein